MFEGDDVFRMLSIVKKGDKWEKVSDEKHIRVAKAPEKFLNVKPLAPKE